MSIIINKPRPLDLIDLEDNILLRIGATERMAVIENDAVVASSLMRLIAGHLKGSGDHMREIRAYAIERGVDFTEIDSV